MTIVLDVSFDDNQQQTSNNDSQKSAIKDVGHKKMKDKHRDSNGCSSKAALKVAKVKTKVS